MVAEMCCTKQGELRKAEFEAVTSARFCYSELPVCMSVLMLPLC